MAPGTYNEDIAPTGYVFFDNLSVEGNTAGDLFGLPQGIVFVNGNAWFNFSGGDSYLTVKNIIVNVAFATAADQETDTLHLSLYNICTKTDGYYFSYTRVLMVNCTDASGNGIWEAWRGGEYYNTITGGSWYGCRSWNEGGPTSYFYNCMSPEEPSAYPIVIQNHIYQVPVFIDPYNNDFHLITGSSGINSGVEHDGYSPDIYGNARPQGSTPDRGAAETVEEFTVTSTNPPQDANNVDPDTDIQITFSDSLDTATISYDTLQVYGWLPEQYEYQWVYDDDTKTLTLTIPGGLETDASIIVNLTNGLKSTGGITLTPYALDFSTAKLPLQQCDPPVIVEPYSARCARPMVILQAPVPARPRAKWRLHFRVQSYADEGGTQLISTIDSSTNPDLFEYSPDSGLTWRDFPIGGLPREQYGKLVRVRAEVGPRKQAWLKASVGAEDA